MKNKLITKVLQHGRITLPASLRVKYNIGIGTKLIWIDNGLSISIVPDPADPITALYGRGKGQGLTRKLLEERALDKTT